MDTAQGTGLGADDGDLSGRTIGGRYAVERIIGRGGYGSVYRATHIRTGDTLAIKVLRASTREDPAVAERFEREARLASSLKHPNTLQVIDYGELPNGAPYLVMPFLEGRTMTDLLRDEGPVDPARLVDIAVQVLGSLSEAHARQVVHRDLKPDNIFLQQVHGKPDHVRVLDFGIAKTLDDPDQDLTRTGTVVGTPKYMSPEQAQGRGIDGRSDLYTLGVILFEALSGQTPHLGETPLATILRRVTEDPPDLQQVLRTPAPRPLCEAIVRAMARDPERRFSDADAMAAALLAAVVPGAPAVAAADPNAAAIASSATMSAPTMPSRAVAARPPDPPPAPAEPTPAPAAPAEAAAPSEWRPSAPVDPPAVASSSGGGMVAVLAIGGVLALGAVGAAGWWWTQRAAEPTTAEPAAAVEPASPSEPEAAPSAPVETAPAAAPAPAAEPKPAATPPAEAAPAAAAPAEPEPEPEPAATPSAEAAPANDAPAAAEPAATPPPEAAPAAAPQPAAEGADAGGSNAPAAAPAGADAAPTTPAKARPKPRPTARRPAPARPRGGPARPNGRPGPSRPNR